MAFRTQCLSWLLRYEIHRIFASLIGKIAANRTSHTPDWAFQVTAFTHHYDCDLITVQSTEIMCSDAVTGACIALRCVLCIFWRLSMCVIWYHSITWCGHTGALSKTCSMSDSICLILIQVTYYITTQPGEKCGIVVQTNGIFSYRKPRRWDCPIDSHRRVWWRRGCRGFYVSIPRQ